MFALSLAQLRAHTSRLIATCLAIVIAVGFVVATLVLNETSKATIYHSVGAPYQHAQAVITADGDGALSTALAKRVEAVDGVRAVAADQTSYPQVEMPGGGSGFRLGQLTGLAQDPILRWQKLASGRLPNADGEVAVGRRKGISLGEKLTLLVPPPAGDTPQEASNGANGSTNDGEPVARTATVVGIIDLQGGIGQGPGDVQMFSTRQQALAWGAEQPDMIRVAAAPGLDSDILTSRLRSALNSSGKQGLVIRSGAQETEHAAADVTRQAATLTQVLLVFAAIAVLVCGLVIANTFAVLLAQRTRELALLRCVGASARQLRRGVLIESVVIGALASLIGVAAGIGGAAVISLVTGRLDAPIPLTGLTVPLRAVLIGVALGTVTTVLAALLPARRATRVAPLAALRVQDPAPARSRTGLLRRIAGVLLLLPSASILGYGAFTGQLLVAMAGGAVSFVAVLLLAQWLVPPAVGLAGRLSRAAAGVPGRLAAANALRNPQRTAATATALIIGVTLTAAMVVGAASTRATASSGLDDAFPTDIVIQSSSDRPLPGGIDQAVKAVPNVSAALALPSALVRGPKSDVAVLGVDPALAAAVVHSSTGAGVPKPGTVNVPKFVAQDWGSEGTTVRLTSGKRSIRLRIHVLPGDQPAGMTAADLARLAPDAGIGAVWVRLAGGLNAGQRADTLDAVTSAAADRAPTSYTQGAFEQRDGYDRVINTLLLIVTGLLAIAVVIAVIGVGNTMALSVLERRQESGLLRALGLTRGQLRRMLLWEAVLISGVASLIGTGLGVAYGLLGTSAALSGQTGLRVAVPWGQLLVIVAVATAAGALASVLPSRRAARTSPVVAIAG